MVLCLAGWPVHIWSVTTSGTGLCIFFSVHLEPAHSEPSRHVRDSPHPRHGQKPPAIIKPSSSLWPKHYPGGSYSPFRVKREVFSKQSFPAVSSCFMCAFKC